MGPIFNDVAAHLVGRGHAATTVQQYIQRIEHVDRWLRRTHRPPSEIDERVIAAGGRRGEISAALLASTSR